MLKSFCMGAVVGYVFGSSKMGMSLRSRLDDAITNLLDSGNEVEDEEIDYLAQRSDNGGSKRNGGNGHNARKNQGSAKKDNGRKEHGKQDNGARGSDKQDHTGKANGNKEPVSRDNGHKDSGHKESSESGHNESTENGGTLPVDKALELAETLSAKPQAPHTDELEPS